MIFVINILSLVNYYSPYFLLVFKYRIVIWLYLKPQPTCFKKSLAWTILLSEKLILFLDNPLLTISLLTMIYVLKDYQLQERYSKYLCNISIHSF